MNVLQNTQEDGSVYQNWYGVAGRLFLRFLVLTWQLSQQLPTLQGHLMRQIMIRPSQLLCVLESSIWPTWEPKKAAWALCSPTWHVHIIRAATTYIQEVNSSKTMIAFTQSWMPAEMTSIPGFTVRNWFGDRPWKTEFEKIDVDSNLQNPCPPDGLNPFETKPTAIGYLNHPKIEDRSW